MKNILRCSIFCTLALMFIPCFYNTTFAQNNQDSILQITTILPGTTQSQPVTVSVKNGMAIMDGDIILGPIKDLLNAEDRGTVINGNEYRWPNGEIPYVIEPGFTASYIVLIQIAIDYINGSTHLLVVPRTTQSDYVHFTPSNVCESYVGRKNSGIQNISLKDVFNPTNNGSGCQFKQIVHEIAHAAGLWHEQSRTDRDSYVTIQWSNIPDSLKHNFNKYNADSSTIIGSYDFNSVMHYGPFAFAINSSMPTIVANNGQTFGNATEYSNGDIATINWMYPVNNCPSNFTLTSNIPLVSQSMVFEASNTITSQATILSGNNIVYDGGVSVILSPGFKATDGSNFRAVIEGCGGIYQRGSNAEAEEIIAEAEANRLAQQGQNTTTNETAAIEMTVSPNPFTEFTTIEYVLPVAQKVDLKLFDLMGIVVRQPLQDDLQEVGTYSLQLKADDLPIGVYFLVMQTSNQKIVKRLIVAH